jgi:hypothetical protein
MPMQAPTMAALEQIHLSSTCRLNGAARVGVIGREARRLDQLANMSSDNEAATPIVRSMMIDQDDYSVCCETPGTSAEPVAVRSSSGWETGPHQARACPFLHDDGGKPGWKRSPQAAVGQTALSTAAIAGGVIRGSVHAPWGRGALTRALRKERLLPHLQTGAAWAHISRAELH